MATEAKDLRKLNLDAPLLSTRRPNSLTSHVNSRRASWDSRNRVPFSWELSAGKPKDAGADQVPDDFPIPPPPGRKLVENDQYDGDDDFSDAIDTFSLSAAIDMVESAEMAKRSTGNMLAGMSLEPCGNESPSFIIQRFLSDAKALAISSGLPIAKNISNQQEKSCKPQIIHTSPKGCGLGLDALFPWRTKHRPRPRPPCGVKSPVRVTAASVKSQWGFKPKPK
ncbi:uncharacterized protein LOC111906735 [Lactuca sativa]|uniref:uncharacterized protein LOC111906735 n=1 Tax=Lactuca sativa TaxID=4236 RepID=UPI000CA816EE|nr:uncharacterized protein LOC111906735 [Lactuca sativa]